MSSHETKSPLGDIEDPKSQAPKHTRTDPQRIEALRYKEGGFHPVHLGDTFQKGRYTVIHKLGHGGYAVVWLARDSKQSRYVALKILAARLSDDCPEVEMLRRLRDGPAHVGKAYVMDLLHHFWIDGPNGQHLCIVSQVGGPSIKLWNESPGLKSGTRRLRAAIARKVSLQATEGLAYIHSLGIVHGDLTSSNILLQLANIDGWTIGEIHYRLGAPHIQKLPEDFVVSVNSKGESRSPKYGVGAISMKDVDPRWLTDQIMILDFGIAFSQEQSSLYIGTPKTYRAPEFLFELPRSVSSDVWALGCTLFEIRTGSSLFKYNRSPKRDKVLKEMVKLLGSLPPSWWESWENGLDWYGRGLKVGGELHDHANGKLYDQIMDIGRYDGDKLSQPTNKSTTTKGGSDEKKTSSSVRSLNTSQYISLIQDLSTDEVVDVLRGLTTDSGLSIENKDDSSSSNQRHSNSNENSSGSGEKGSGSNEKGSASSNLVASEGIANSQRSASTPSDPPRKKNILIEDDDLKKGGASSEEATSSSKVTYFLEPAGTMISEVEAKVLENLLRKALKFLPDERLGASEIAKHHWFFDDFETAVIDEDAVKRSTSGADEQSTDEEEEEDENGC